MNEVYIIDACMGSGKTSAMINMINKSNKEERFLYVTPLLSETERIIKSCSQKHFKTPEKLLDKKTKTKNKKEGIIKLLREKSNIVTTHALFHLFNDEILELCSANNYILVMDEVTDVISEYKTNPDDLSDFLNAHAYVDEDGLVTWVNNKEVEQDTYEGEKFLAERELCELGCVMVYKETALLYIFPIKIFNTFAKTYVLTYLFKGQMQRYYYDYYGVKYEYLYVKGHSLKEYEITDEPQVYSKPSELKSLINICDSKRLNAIGESQYSLSKSWFEKPKKKKKDAQAFTIKDLKNNMRNYLWRHVGGSSDNSLWSVFDDYEQACIPQGYKKSFLACNTRASNEYKDTFNLAYCINLYMNPCIKNFFESHYVQVDDDLYSLSTMIQWIWRSRIRDGKPINIYIPSKRMRSLLIKWLNNEMEEL